MHSSSLEAISKRSRSDLEAISRRSQYQPLPGLLFVCGHRDERTHTARPRHQITLVGPLPLAGIPRRRPSTSSSTRHGSSLHCGRSSVASSTRSPQLRSASMARHTLRRCGPPASDTCWTQTASCRRFAATRNNHQQPPWAHMPLHAPLPHARAECPPQTMTTWVEELRALKAANHPPTLITHGYVPEADLKALELLTIVRRDEGKEPVVGATPTQNEALRRF